MGPFPFPLWFCRPGPLSRPVALAPKSPSSVIGPDDEDALGIDLGDVGSDGEDMNGSDLDVDDFTGSESGLDDDAGEMDYDFLPPHTLSHTPTTLAHAFQEGDCGPGMDAILSYRTRRAA